MNRSPRLNAAIKDLPIRSKGAFVIETATFQEARQKTERLSTIVGPSAGWGRGVGTTKSLGRNKLNGRGVGQIGRSAKLIRDSQRIANQKPKQATRNPIAQRESHERPYYR